MQPTSAEETAEAVRAHHGVVAVGGATKPATIGAGERIEMREFSGIVEYEPSEYTFTAAAGTLVSEVRDSLRAKRQYLPFDPLLVEAGATLGGTVAAGTAGPGRFRYGGLRDFLVGVQFVDGNGRLVRAGGKVVKNAAGFDLPKFLVGSLGRFGVLTELSFKVFPAPLATATLQVQCPDHRVAVERLAEVACSRWEADALDYDAAGRSLWIRLGGPSAALDQLCREIDGRWAGEVRRVEESEAAGLWRSVTEAAWCEEGTLLAKVPVTPSRILALEERLEGLPEGRRWYSAGGAVAWLTSGPEELPAVQEALVALGLPGLVLRGGVPGALWLGPRPAGAIEAAVKRALDPEARFPAL